VLYKPQETLWEMLERLGVIVRGHFVLRSGEHARAYFNKDAVYPHTAETSQLCRILAEFADPVTQIVAAPAIGGVVLSQWVAYHLSNLLGTEVLAVYAEPGPEDTFVFRRGYDKLVAEKRAFVVEDTVTTGGSATKIVNAVRMLGGDVAGIGVLCNRGGVTAEQLGVPWLRALVAMDEFERWTSEECLEKGPCSRGVSADTHLGHGTEFMRMVELERLFKGL